PASHEDQIGAYRSRAQSVCPLFPFSRHKVSTGANLQTSARLEAAADDGEGAGAAQDGEHDPAVEALAAGVRRHDGLDLGDLRPVVLVGIERSAQLDVGAVQIDGTLAGRVPDGEDE